MLRRFVPLAALAAALCACGDEEPTPADGTADAGADAASDAADAAATPDGSGAGVDGSDAGVFSDVDGPSSYVLVVDEITGTREEGRYVSYGFDLDGRVSDESDDESCGHQDFTSPDGETGIDNQFALLLPIIEGAGGQALEDLIQAAINDGNILVVLELDGLDDLHNDDDVSMTLMRGVGNPVLGFDARLAPDQTFDVDPEGQYEHADGLTLADGVLRATGLEFTLPVYVFEYLFPMDLTQGVVEIRFNDDGTATGRLAGAVQVANVAYLAEEAAIPSSFRDLLIQIASSYADMDRGPDGKCNAFSVTFNFTATTAFLYSDAQRPSAD